MSNSNYLVAFDVSDQFVRAAVGRAVDDQVEILAVEQRAHRLSNCVQSGQVKQISDLAYTLVACTRLLENRLNGEKLSSAFVSIGGAGMRTIRSTGRRESAGILIVSERMLKEILEETVRIVKKKHEEAGQPICVIEHYEHRYWIDGVEKKDIRSLKGKVVEVEYVFVIAPTLRSQEGNVILEKNYITNIERAFSQSGLSIEKIFLKSDALSTALLESQEREEGCALIDFGCGSTGLCIHKGGQVQFTGYVPIGGKHITEDISSLGISFADAEKLKRRYGQALESAIQKPYIVNVPSTLEDTPICKVNTRLLNRIIEARQRQALYAIVKQIKQNDVKHLVITGEGSRLRDLDTLLQEMTDLSPRLGSHDVWVTQGVEDIPAYSLLVGTLILGMSYRRDNPHAKPDTPLIPRNLKEKAKKVGGFISGLFD